MQLIIGDIHGCRIELEELLHQARRGKLALDDLQARIRETRKLDRLLGGSGSMEEQEPRSCQSVTPRRVELTAA